MHGTGQDVEVSAYLFLKPFQQVFPKDSGRPMAHLLVRQHIQQRETMEAAHPRTQHGFQYL